MSKKLIVVADDFGFSEAYNYGVIKAYKEGVVCTLSLMSNMAAVPHAVKLWQSECPEVPLVQHTNFVQYRPVSAPEKGAHAGKRRGNVLPQLSVEERESQ